MIVVEYDLILINVVKSLTVAPVDQVRPDDHLLGEAEHAETAALQLVVEDVTGVCHHVLT